MVTATFFGLAGPLALIAALVLNAVLLWRATPNLCAALLGARPTLVPARVRPDGESNVIALRPGLRRAVPTGRAPAHRRLAA